jgi:hypothetical protein
MNFDLDYEIDGILYCVSIKASAHDDFKIMDIGRYLPANNRRTKILYGEEADEIEKILIYDNTFIDMVSEEYLSKLQDEYRHERYK